MNSVIAAEGIKLAIQLIGAIAIARLTVSWALSRYKSEKTWERQLDALIDAITALSEMRSLVGRWYDQAITYRESSAAEDEKQRARYQEAIRRLNEGIAAAQLVLPFAMASKLSSLTDEMEATRQGQNYVEELDDLYGLIDRTLTELRTSGRSLLKASPSNGA